MPERSEGSGTERESRAAAADESQAPLQPARIVTITGEAGQRIDNYLVKTLPSVPKSRVYRMLRSGEVRVNGGRKKPTYRLCAGDQVRIPPHRAARGKPDSFISDSTLEELEAAIVFEDDDLLVLNKPAGIAVHGGSGLSFGLIEALRRLRGDQLELGHRLDRDTSGCLLLARRRSALTELHQIIRSGDLKKQYRLIVHGRWPRDLTSVRFPLQRYHTASGERRVRVAAEGKPSRTDMKVLARSEAATLLEATLLTGRTHQIRVHARAAGHPIVGDSKYASDEQLEEAAALGIHRLCLHAAEVVLPWRGRSLKFHCPPPEDFTRAWELLGGA